MPASDDVAIGASVDGPRISVVVPVRDGAGIILEQLEAIAAQRCVDAWEIVVADNGSADGTPELVAAWADGRGDVRLIDASGVPGPAYARNLGASRARGELLLFADADDRVLPGWMAAMRAALSHHEAVGAVRVRSHAPSSPAAPVPPSFPFLPWVGGGNLGVRREVFEAASGFDESLQLGEDVDLCWRLQVGGASLCIDPTARVWHRERPELRAAFAQSWRFGSASRELYRRFEVHGARWPGWRRDVRTFAWLVGGVPAAVLSTSRRRRWVTRLGGQLGLIAGTWRSARRQDLAGSGRQRS